MKTHKFFSALKAFTLAEVLVTLTILGIVATIVVPNLMQQYKKVQTISRLKMAYSILDNMTQRSYIENGYPPVGLSTVNIIDIFDTYFGKYLNIQKDCATATSPDVMRDSGCFKSGKYHNYGESDYAVDKDGNALERDMFYYMDGSDNSTGGSQPTYYYKVVLKNGMSLGVYNNRSDSYGYTMTIDIDGPNKGDSKVGQDVFQFVYYAPNVGIKGTSCPNVGLYPTTSGIFSAIINDENCKFSRENFLEKCAEGTNGSGCAGLIINDGWKISKDYPWDYAQKKIK